MLFEFENANGRNYIIANLTFVPKNYTISYNLFVCATARMCMCEVSKKKNRMHVL